MSRFGTHGQRLYELAHGIDDRPVNPQRAVKSIGEEETFALDLSDNDTIQAVLLQQAQGVARRLRKRELTAKTITVKIKLAERLGEGKFRLYTRSRSLPAPTNDASEIYRAAALLFQSVPRKTHAVRLAGIYTSAKTANLFGNPIYLLARWRERMEVRVVEISFHSPHPSPLPKEARELLFPNRCLEAALVIWKASRTSASSTCLLHPRKLTTSANASAKLSTV